MRNLWLLSRFGPRPQALHYSYEKAGLTVHDQPVPWNAEVVMVEGRVRLPAGVVRRKADFMLHLGGRPGVAADVLRKHDKDDGYYLAFRLHPVPKQTAVVELHWRNQNVAQVTLPVFGRDEFLQKLRLSLPTLFVRLGAARVTHEAGKGDCPRDVRGTVPFSGPHHVACHTFVSSQSRGLMASAVLSSSTALAPLVDLGLHVEFRPDRGGPAQEVPVQLCASQLADRQALVSAVPRGFPRRIGAWTVTWKLGDLVLASQPLRAISHRHFQRSLRVGDTRFVAMTTKGEIVVGRQPPPLEELRWLRPCFLVSSAEPGMAGVCRLRIQAQTAGPALAPGPLEQEALITDGPSWFAPGTEDAAKLAHVSGFELLTKEQTLGVLSMSPVPAAAFNAEGGFKPAVSFAWSLAADEELHERLGRLQEKRAGEG